MASWSLTNLKITQATTDDTAVFLSSTDDPTLTQFESFVVSDNILLRWNIVNHSLLAVVFALCFLLLSVMNIKGSFSFSWMLVIISVAYSFLGGKISDVVLRHKIGAPSIEYTVGYASFIGHSKLSEKIAFFLPLVIGMILTGFLVWAVKRLGWVNEHTNPRISEEKKSSNFSLWFFTSLILVYAFYSFPQLSMVYNQLLFTNHTPQWDMNNVFTWQYEVYRGWLPYRDFWYPYSGLYNMSAPFPMDMLRFYFHHLIVISALGFSIYAITEWNKKWTCFIVLALLVARENVWFHTEERYFMALDLYILFFALNQMRWGKVAAILYACFAGWVLYTMPDRLIYAAPPVLLFAALQWIERRKNKVAQREYLWNFVISGIVFTFLATIYFLWLYTQGQLDGFWEFYSRLKNMTTSAAIPSPITSWFRFSIVADALLCYSILVSLTYGFYLILQRRRQPEYRLGRFVFFLGCLAVMVFQKQLVRPHMSIQIIGYFIVGGLLFLFYWSQEWNKRQRLTMWFCCMLFLTVFVRSHGLDPVLSKIRQIEKIGPNLAILRDETKKIEKRQARYFALESFSLYPDVEKFSEFYWNYRQANPQGLFYVLGDDSYLYIVTGQKPPYCLTFYDESDIEYQKIVVRWLTENRVDLVVWDPMNKDFDGVPNIVRDPIVFSYVIEHYVPYEQVGHFEILKRSDSESTIDLDYWLKTLGNSIDLGHIPRQSTVYSLPDQDQGHALLEIDIDHSQKERQRHLFLESDGQSMRVDFVQHPNTQRYYIYLERIWFWHCLKRYRVGPNLAGELDPDLHIKMVYKSPQDRYLY